METIRFINSLLEKAGVVCTHVFHAALADTKQTEPSLLNFVVSDGETVVATRFVHPLPPDPLFSAQPLLGKSNFSCTELTTYPHRYISSRTSEASSLFFSSGTSFDEYQEGGLYRMTKADKRENIIMIASEPLTFERNDWMEVKTNTMIIITPKVGPARYLIFLASSPV